VKVQADWWSSLEEEEGQEMFGYTLMSMLARSSLKFGRATDGSLLVRQSMVGSLMVLEWPIFPMAESDWIRFPPATPRPEPEREPGIPAVAQELQAGMLP
jgi:hypothetical protein